LASAAFLYINAITSYFHKKISLATSIAGLGIIPLVLSVVYTGGYDTGDMVLKHMAKLFRNNTRELDAVARIGGEEFLMIFPRTPKHTGLGIAEKIREIINDSPYKDKEFELQLTVSLGCTDVSKCIFIEEAIKQADKLLYQAKRNGRNRLEA